MARATFTSEQLCKTWAKHAQSQPKGTRGDVVVDLMGQIGLDPKDDNAYRKVYNNVTQRVKQLGINFPALRPGQKGAKRTPEQLASLQAILNPSDEE